MPTKTPSENDEDAATGTGREEVRHFNQKQLARRWGISHRTLERWRGHGEGPIWFKVGSRVLYRIEDVIRFEQTKLAVQIEKIGNSK
jgi:hypothetical protein